MKSLNPIAGLVTLLFLLGCGQGSTGEENESARGPEPDRNATPLEIVNRRMSAYNRHDLEAFLDLYAGEVEIFTYPDRSLGKGKEHMRSIFEPMFTEGVVQVVVHHQIMKDSYVVNHETVTDGGDTTEYISIYEVEGGLIQSVGFVRN